MQSLYDQINETFWAYKPQTPKSNATIPQKGKLTFGKSLIKHRQEYTKRENDPKYYPPLYFVPFQKNTTDLAWSKAKLCNKLMLLNSEKSAWEHWIQDAENNIQMQNDRLTQHINQYASAMKHLKKSDVYHANSSLPDKCLYASVLQQGHNDFTNYMEHAKKSFDTLYEYVLKHYKAFH